jgi:hypothetical protein
MLQLEKRRLVVLISIAIVFITAGILSAKDEQVLKVTSTG